MPISFVDYRINKNEEANLKKLGVEIIKCPPCKQLYQAICGHPDMILHIINNKKIIVNKDIDKNFISKLNSFNIDVILSKNSLKIKYPYDIILNAVSMDYLFFHYINYTDPNLLLQLNNKKQISVKQGYTKCSTAIINSKAIITSDKSIDAAMKKENIDSLLLPPGDILLPGFDYGFIGGCCGMVTEKEMAFYGNLNYYKYGKEVLNFLYKYNVKPIFLSDGKLIDRGSILTINI
ncbi:DUF6873 family GME fold protein [Clostridium rectalis]|uniref:DUF6873 family GME fold protein n=1 Tax=Clostridium rectalis TaxID=2040295 RepID=UPI000F6327D8|nr:hypothetical protein [Clostridium rectalis]